MKELGNLEKIYKIKLQNKLFAPIFGIACLAGGAIFPLGVLLDDSFIPKNSSSLFVFFFGGLSLFLGGMGIFMIYSGFQLINDHLCLYENGLVLTHKNQVHTAKWDEIKGLGESAVEFVVNGLPSRVNYSFTVTKFDGEKFVLHTFLNNIEEIGERLSAEVYKRRLPVVLENFNRGETVRFGKFSINQSSLFSEKHGQLSLFEIEKIEIFEGTIYIYKKNKGLPWDRAKYASIPNARILLTIWESIR